MGETISEKLKGCVTGVLLCLLMVPQGRSARAEQRSLPTHVPPKRSSQIHDGFGINSDLPREPYLPWNRWWWTRLFDAGVKWARIGQYENSSDQTSWDWVEQRRGVYALPPRVDDYVDSLAENGVNVQVQLLYGNPLYTSPAGKLPNLILPAPGSFHNPDRSLYSIFWPPKTPEQIAAFIQYVDWMVNHFRGRVRYWALWNEQDITYWNPVANAEEYGRLLKAFVEAVHKTDPGAKVIYGAQAGLRREFTKRAFDVCQCTTGIDVYAYHTYPGYGRNLNPETMDSGAYGENTTRALREMVSHYPGIRSDIEFWDDEFNSIPSWQGSDESVQSKYIPRGLIYNWAAGVKTFVWLLVSGTDGNEYDDFGMIHGMTFYSTDFTPRPVFHALQNTNALFSDTKPDPSIGFRRGTVPLLNPPATLMTYAFRSRTGKAIVAYWMAAKSEPANAFPSVRISLTLSHTGITHPVLIDVVSGEISPLQWKEGTTDVLESVPIRDSVMAIADESYFDWAVLPEAPSSLRTEAMSDAINLRWENHGEGRNGVIVERRTGAGSRWERIAKLPASATEYSDAHADQHQRLSYRVRAANDAGESAYSNIVTPTCLH